MPFGVSNSPAVFQTLVNDVLRDTFNRFVFVYLDDILIFSQNKRHHIQHVRLVLQWLLENRLFAKLEKCEFHVRSVPFLGFILSPEGIRMDPGKVEAVANWPTPDSRKGVQPLFHPPTCSFEDASGHGASPDRLPACKLGPEFIGPYIVAKVLNPVTVRLKLPPMLKKNESGISCI